MHTSNNALETLEIMWNNYLTISEQVDLEAMPPKSIENLDPQTKIRPYRIAAWLVRDGYFISFWSLWEFYSRNLISDLNINLNKNNSESTVSWMSRCLNAKDIDFPDEEWFSSALILRNLIAHNGGRIDNKRSENLINRCQKNLADIETYIDGYIDISHGLIADLYCKIEDFIENTDSQIK